jgi:regulatory protein
MPAAAPSLKGRALRLLSMREHSRVELERKLAPHAQDAQQLADLLDELSAKDFINPVRVTQSVLHQRAGKWGSARILQELERKGLPNEHIEQAQLQLKGDEYERALAVHQKKFGAAAPRTPSEYGKQARFLASRGFSGDVVTRVLRQARRFDNDSHNPSELSG